MIHLEKQGHLPELSQRCVKSAVVKFALIDPATVAGLGKNLR